MVSSETLLDAVRRHEHWQTGLGGLVLPTGSFCEVSGPAASAKTELLYTLALTCRPSRLLLWVDADGRFDPLRLHAIGQARGLPEDALSRIAVVRARSAPDLVRILDDVKDDDVFAVIVDGANSWINIDSGPRFRAARDALSQYCKRGGIVVATSSDSGAHVPPASRRLTLSPSISIALAYVEGTRPPCFKATVSGPGVPRTSLQVDIGSSGCTATPIIK
ncbi:DNA recombination and repair protein Rad51-like C-terminal domain-containing protein [Plasmodiophora brassicae]